MYRRHVTNVYRYLFSRVENVDDAQDLTTQTFLAAKESIANYQRRGSLAAWLMGIARHKATDSFRRRHFQVIKYPAFGSAFQAEPPLLGFCPEYI
ncbi:MAG: sigma factor [Cyanobacteria bacterium P01_D01_bin.50]